MTDLEGKCRELDPTFEVRKENRQDRISIVCSMRIRGRPVSIGRMVHPHEVKITMKDLLADCLAVLRSVLESEAMATMGTCEAGGSSSCDVR